MYVGIILFYCTECKKKFKSPGFEYMATNIVKPCKCPMCGSMRTRPWVFYPSCWANKKYKSIWNELKE